jgi:NADH dehydrogenase (ubiquinone) Fe-S protein 6
MASSQLRSIGALARQLRVPRRAFATTTRQLSGAVPAGSRTETSATLAEETQIKPVEQAPNRVETWSRSQKPRSTAMSGPRFEQTEFHLQVS